MKAEISYGKGQVSVYRTYAKPLEGVTPIAESDFTGRANILFAAEIDVEVFGDNFMPAYTEGDNSNVVATDSMKNFILQESLNYGGSTLEGLLYFLGQRFLNTYPQMQTLRLTGREQPFAAAQVPGESGFGGSNVLFSRSHDDYALAVLDMTRAGDAPTVTDHECGRIGLQLIKVTGSSFSSFVRDNYTTLEERPDRPLFIYLDLGWRYAAAGDMLGDDHSRYVPAEQVRDLVGAVFHRFVSMSIQHLVYEMGLALLDRFPQLAEVSFSAQNRLWDSAFTDTSDKRLKTYTDPRPPYGMIRLKLRRDE